MRATEQHRLDNAHAPIAWVDICKGLGIYLVVFGHTDIPSLLQHCIYLFSMPLFFFVSGYLHKIRSDRIAFFRKKRSTFWCPTSAFCYCSTLSSLAVSPFPPPSLRARLAAYLFACFWGGDQLRGQYGIFWFLPCLFMAQQLFNLLLTRYRLRVVAILVGFGLVLSDGNAYFAPQLSLPLDAQVVPAALPFLFAGFLCRRNPHVLSTFWIATVAIVGVAAGIWLETKPTSLSYDMRGGVYGIPGLTFALALCFIGATVTISKCAARLSPARQLLMPLGAASMGIMFIHKQLPSLPYLSTWSAHHAYPASFVFTAISMGVTLLIERSSIARALLLGSERDFHRLFVKNNRLAITIADSQSIIHPSPAPAP